jgi:hypothetical protein
MFENIKVSHAGIIVYKSYFENLAFSECTIMLRYSLDIRLVNYSDFQRGSNDRSNNAEDIRLFVQTVDSNCLNSLSSYLALLLPGDSRLY